MYSLIKRILFLFSPEKAHRITMFFLDAAVRIGPFRAILEQFFCSNSPAHQRRLMGLEFPNFIGLAAGFDKNGRHIESLARLGFGFIEVGTVTPLPQPGNPQPRLFRLPADEALINRMGFNNDGVDALVAQLKKIRSKGAPLRIVIGGNIGKNKNTPNEEAENDYVKAFEALYPWVDYFVVNVSSPNTPGLRALQEKEPLSSLLTLLQFKNDAIGAPKPILLKIAPDLTDSQLDDVAEIVGQTRLAGIIATNTTISREGLTTSKQQLDAIGAGGLSGAPVTRRATEVIRYLRSKIGAEKIIIGVGGVDSPETAHEKLAAGADLIQIYTGFIYKGPGLVRNILDGLSDIVSEDKMQTNS